MSQNTLEDQDEGIVSNSSQPDYSAVNVPAEPPTEYHYTERRAELLQLVEQSGHPAALNQTELADRYGVSQQQISKDLDRLDEHVRARLGRRRDLTVRSVLDRAMCGLLEEGEYYQAAQVAEMLNDYLEGRMDTLEFRRRIERLETAVDDEEVDL